MTVFLRLCLALLLLAGSFSGAMAQDSTAPSLSAPAVTPAPDGTLAPKEEALIPGSDTPLPAESYILPQDIPDILMAEVLDIKKNCELNALYAAYHDCNCIAVKFLDARVKSDPDTPKDRVFNQVRNECANTPMIAGVVYKSCVSFRKSEDPEGYVDYCTCAANDVARRYTEQPNMNLRYMKKLRKEAYIACGIDSKRAYVAR